VGTHFRALAAAVGLLAVLASVSCRPDQGQTVEYHPDYPFYETPDALYERADLVVAATVESTDGAQELFGGGEDEPIVYTIFRAMALDAYKGDIDAGQVIQVKLLGGDLDGTTYLGDQATFLKIDTTYVLFLATFPDAPASLLNPQQAQYAVSATGELASLPDNPIQLTTADLERLAGAGSG
jgi:hypothetical protein